MEKARKTKVVLILILSIIITFARASICHSEYRIEQLTNSSFSEDRPQINDNGYVVWEGYDGSDREIFLYDGTSISNISNNSFADWFPQINNNNYVVWEGSDGSDGEIFLYNGMNTIQISNNSYDDFSPQINNNGYVVWFGSDGHDYEIFLYDGTSITQITNNSGDDWNPQINNNGYVVWYGSDGNDFEIFLYDGTSISNISNNSYNDYDPQLNNNGYVAWYGYDGHDYEIFLYNGMNTIQLTNNLYDDEYFHINDDGHVVFWNESDNSDFRVWTQYDSSDFEIFLYDDTGTTQITNNSYDDLDPQVNNNGYIVWLGCSGTVCTDVNVYLATPTTIALNAPNGGEAIPSGSTYLIQWSTFPGVTKFDLYYSVNNGGTWNPIASKITGTSYNWTVPTPTKNKKNCLVKVIGYDASGSQVSEDISDSTFTIEVVKVTSPNGEENWKVGSTHAITWTTNGTKKPVASVKLFYTYNGGATWILIKTLNGNPGAYNWRASANSANCKVKVVLMDAIGKTIGSDVSDHLFTISP